MRRTLIVVLAATASTVALAIPASGATSTVFRVAVKNVSTHRSHDGQVFTLRDRLVRPRDHDDVVGHDKVRCRIVSRTDARCRTVAFFPQGKVKAKGVINLVKARKRLSIIGGTRGYNGVAGKEIVNTRPRLSRVTFYLIR